MNEHERQLEIYQKAYNDAQSVILAEIGIWIEGLESVQSHCKDERTAFALDKYIHKIKQSLSLL